MRPVGGGFSERSQASVMLRVSIAAYSGISCPDPGAKGAIGSPETGIGRFNPVCYGLVKCLVYRGFGGADAEGRTPGLLITNQLLYH